MENLVYRQKNMATFKHQTNLWQTTKLWCHLFTVSEDENIPWKWYQQKRFFIFLRLEETKQGILHQVMWIICQQVIHVKSEVLFSKQGITKFAVCCSCDRCSKGQYIVYISRQYTLNIKISLVLKGNLTFFHLKVPSAATLLMMLLGLIITQWTWYLKLYKKHEPRPEKTVAINKQYRCRSDCAYAQSDWGLYCLLLKIIIVILVKYKFSRL